MVEILCVQSGWCKAEAERRETPEVMTKRRQETTTKRCGNKTRQENLTTGRLRAYNSSVSRHHLNHLSFQGIYRSFGRLRVLMDVSGEAGGGELLLITGTNGSGKSTLLRCLAGLMRVQRGTITCRQDGEPLDLESRRRALGFLSPDLSFYSELSTLENLELFARLRGIDPQRGKELLDRLDLSCNRRAGALSSGMRQRLRWAFALLHKPKILLLDEPLQNLDAPGRRDATALLAEHLKDGLAVVANPDPMDLPQVDRHVELAR